MAMRAIFLAGLCGLLAMNSPLNAQSTLDYVDDEAAQDILKELQAQEVDPQNVISDLVQSDHAELLFLDRLNGAVQSLFVDVGETVHVEYLDITVQACMVPADDAASDAVIYLTIQDVRQEAPSFQGWMIASSPALSALEHQRYDVWALRCNAQAG